MKALRWHLAHYSFNSDFVLVSKQLFNSTCRRKNFYNQPLLPLNWKSSVFIVAAFWRIIFCVKGTWSQIFLKIHTLILNSIAGSRAFLPFPSELIVMAETQLVTFLVDKPNFLRASSIPCSIANSDTYSLKSWSKVLYFLFWIFLVFLSVFCLLEIELVSEFALSSVSYS